MHLTTLPADGRDREPIPASLSDDQIDSRSSFAVFVDATGRRRRRLRYAAFALCLACALYVGLIATSVAGGSSGPRLLAPLPGIDDAPDTLAIEPPDVPDLPDADTDTVARAPRGQSTGGA